MIECPTCRIKYVPNTLFCAECGLYLAGNPQPGTDPLESAQVDWMGEAGHCHAPHPDSPDTGPLIIRLRIGEHASQASRAVADRTRSSRPHARQPLAKALRRKNRQRAPQPGARPSKGAGASAPARQGRPAHPNGRLREVEIPLTRPIRLGRMDPVQSIYPEVDLTDDLALEKGVSRRHACILRRGNVVEVEDLGSINGTLLNGKRLAPFIPEPLQDGDQLQLGWLLIEVCFKAGQVATPPTGNIPVLAGAA